VSHNGFDREHVVEEIKDLGKSERAAVRSQVWRIIEHFLKLAHSRAEQPRWDWMETIDDARKTLSDKLRPTLRRDAESNVEALYAGRRRAARGLQRHNELGAAEELPLACPWSLDDIGREDWYPAAPEPR
jgi:hypothetical protein